MGWNGWERRGDWKNYFMSLIFRYVHYPQHNLCFCFFLLLFKEHEEFFVDENMEKKEDTKREKFITHFLKEMSFMVQRR